MGRGLSDLQRWILSEAQKCDRLYTFNICEGYYGWKQKPSFWSGERSDSHSGQKFSRAEIGEREYARVKSTISRTCVRLENRGLVTRVHGEYGQWFAVRITEEGAKYGRDETHPLEGPDAEGEI